MGHFKAQIFQSVEGVPSRSISAELCLPSFAVICNSFSFSLAWSFWEVFWGDFFIFLFCCCCFLCFYHVDEQSVGLLQAMLQWMYLKCNSEEVCIVFNPLRWIWVLKCCLVGRHVYSVRSSPLWRAHYNTFCDDCYTWLKCENLFSTSKHHLKSH